MNNPDVISALILVVDDDQDILDLLKYNLEKDGFRTKTEVSSESVLQLFPNPANNGKQIITYVLEGTSNVKIAILNMMGQELQTSFKNQVQAGKQTESRFVESGSRASRSGSGHT